MTAAAPEPDYKQRKAIKLNVRNMRTPRLVRELAWLETQREQPPIRRALILEMKDELRRRAEAGDRA